MTSVIFPFYGINITLHEERSTTFSHNSRDQWTNRNKQKKASPEPRSYFDDALSHIFKTIDSICIPHHLISKTFLSSNSPSNRSILASSCTKSKKQDQSHNGVKTPGSDKRKRYDARTTFSSRLPTWQKKIIGHCPNANNTLINKRKKCFKYINATYWKGIVWFKIH